MEEKTNLLLAMDYSFHGVDGWQDAFHAIGNALLQEAYSKVVFSNQQQMRTVLSPLKQALSVDDLDYAAGFSREMRKCADPIFVCQLMEAIGFSAEDIVGAAPEIVPLLMRSVLDNTPIKTGFTENDIFDAVHTPLVKSKRGKMVSDGIPIRDYNAIRRILESSVKFSAAEEFDSIRVNLWKVNDLLGIQSLSDYSIREDSGTDEFFDTYASFSNAVRDAEKYRKYAPNAFLELDRYRKLLEQIHEILLFERSVLSKPDNIKAEDIEKLVSSWKYQNAVCCLYGKLKYNLRIICNADGKAQVTDLIDRARDHNIIPWEKVSEFHALRTARNSFLQPEFVRQQPLDAKKFAVWKELVFNLEEKRSSLPFRI